MSTLMQASHQWASRPADERFTSLLDMRDHFQVQRSQSRELVVPSRRIHALPDPDNKGLSIVGPNGHAYNPTHHAFGQVAALAEAPAGYMRTLPSPIAADCLNYGLQFKRQIEDVGVLLQKNGEATLRAATGPRYGRIWNDDVVAALTRTVGDGVSGDWRVPGEFGRAVTVTKANTTLFAGDRDFFVFLADEQHKIEVPNTRSVDARTARPLSRGFFVWNSEVGAMTFGLATFLFDYVCCNRIVWGAQDVKEIKIRHTISAPDKFLEEIQPALLSYANGSQANVLNAVKAAQAKHLDADKVDAFLKDRFGKPRVEPIKAAHLLEEGRPIETLWDVTTGATAYAKGIKWQDERVAVERVAGEVMQLAA
jgi:hypothetical protein